MTTKLAEAADTFLRAPVELQAAILEAAADGDNAPTIFHAIKEAYSLDYVRQLIGDARKAGKIPPRVIKPKS
jgi:hypothetical protein